MINSKNVHELFQGKKCVEIIAIHESMRDNLGGSTGRNRKGNSDACIN